MCLRSVIPGTGIERGSSALPRIYQVMQLLGHGVGDSARPFKVACRHWKCGLHNQELMHLCARKDTTLIVGHDRSHNHHLELAYWQCAPGSIVAHILIKFASSAAILFQKSLRVAEIHSTKCA